jgi:hypothetical protein
MEVAAVALAVAVFLCFTQYLQHQRRVLVHRERLAANTPSAADVPRGLQWVGLAPAMIGLSHLIVYALGRSREK